MEELILRVEVNVNLTESEEKVKKAVENLFGNIPIHARTSSEAGVLTFEAKGQDVLVKFRNLLRNDRIRDAARKAFFKEINGNKIKFCLNKQVAFAGHVSFSEESGESPLGPIEVTIQSDTPQQLINWLAPKTA